MDTRFRIEIVGQLPVENDEQAVIVERGILVKVRSLVDVLPGLTDARFTGDQLLERDLITPAKAIA